MTQIVSLRGCTRAEGGENVALKANYMPDESDDLRAMVQQEGQKAADNRPDDGAVQVETPVNGGVHFRLQPVPFLLGVCFGSALYILLSLLFKGS